jgi:hypothetical protein
LLTSLHRFVTHQSPDLVRARGPFQHTPQHITHLIRRGIGIEDAHGFWLEQLGGAGFPVLEKRGIEPITPGIESLVSTSSRPFPFDLGGEAVMVARMGRFPLGIRFCIFAIDADGGQAILMPFTRGPGLSDARFEEAMVIRMPPAIHVTPAEEAIGSITRYSFQDPIGVRFLQVVQEVQIVTKGDGITGDQKVGQIDFLEREVIPLRFSHADEGPSSRNQA